MSKYEPLQSYLAQHDAQRISLTFDQVEQILGTRLPNSARTHPAWWANNPTGHSHSRAWFNAGWRTENLNLTGRKVDFVRASKTPPATPPRSDTGGRDPWGALAGTVTIKSTDALFDPIGDTWNAEKGHL